MKNKILNYDFLIVGGGLVGSLAAIALYKKKYKVLVIEKNNFIPDDQRTLAVNANSRDFLRQLGMWGEFIADKEPINQIIIKDSINKEDLIFQDDQESMGTVIYNKKLLQIARNYLIKKKILLAGIDFSLNKMRPQSIISINKKNYFFNKMIISLGKNYENNEILNKTKFKSLHQAYVGFFDHQKNHNQIAYEIFTPNGPLAVLPSPSTYKKSSTFIYSTKDEMNFKSLSKIIKNNFQSSHGKLKLKSKINSYPITPHISRPLQKNILIIGDTAHSIHPVAGQGWNLGIKDIQVLCESLDKYNVDDLNFDNIYFSKRIFENLSYLTFTNALNLLYESKKPIAKSLIKTSFSVLNKTPFIKNLFIRQAMGKINLV